MFILTTNKSRFIRGFYDEHDAIKAGIEACNTQGIPAALVLDFDTSGVVWVISGGNAYYANALTMAEYKELTGEPVFTIDEYGDFV